MGVQILWSCGKMNTLLIAQVAGALECKNVRGERLSDWHDVAKQRIESREV